MVELECEQRLGEFSQELFHQCRNLNWAIFRQVNMVRVLVKLVAKLLEPLYVSVFAEYAFCGQICAGQLSDARLDDFWDRNSTAAHPQIGLHSVPLNQILQTHFECATYSSNIG